MKPCRNVDIHNIYYILNISVVKIFLGEESYAFTYVGILVHDTTYIFIDSGEEYNTEVFSINLFINYDYVLLYDDDSIVCVC